MINQELQILFNDYCYTRPGLQITRQLQSTSPVPRPIGALPVPAASLTVKIDLNYLSYNVRRYLITKYDIKF